MSNFGTSLANSTSTKLVLYNLLNNKRFFYSVIDMVDQRHFYGCFEVETVIMFILEYYSSSNEMIGKNTLIAKIDTQFGGTQSHDNLLKYVEAIYVINELSDSDTLLDMLVSIVKKNLLLNKSLDVANMIRDPDDAKINKVIEDFSAIEAISFVKSEYDDFMPKTKEEFLASLHDERIRIPFKIKDFNDATDGGVMRGTLNTIIGGTGAGKTLTMLSLMIDYLELGFHCAYISLELGANMIKPRFWANVLDVPLSELNNFKYSRMTDAEVIKKYENPFRATMGRSTLKCSEPNSFTARDIERYIIGFEKLNNIQIDVVFIDHLSLMPTYGGFKDQTMASKYGQTQAEEAITLAKRLDLAVWTGAQFNRGNMNGVDGDMTGIAGSIGVTHASDLVMSIHADNDVGALLWKKHKCRYSDVSINNKGHVGIDRAKQRLYDYDGRIYEMTEFDARFEEVSRNNTENNIYIPTDKLEKIINNENLTSGELEVIAQTFVAGGADEIVVKPKEDVEVKTEKKHKVVYDFSS